MSQESQTGSDNELKLFTQSSFNRILDQMDLADVAVINDLLVLTAFLTLDGLVAYCS